MTNKKSTYRAGDARGRTGSGPAGGEIAPARRAARRRGASQAATARSAAALITGCSSGIGHAAALRLSSAGFDVYASARRPEALEDLTAAGITTVRLDVTDERSMRDVIARITAEHGALGILVNNAGFELAGPVEEVPLAEAHRLFDTNVFGLARLTQLAIPCMREAGGGRIINLSSVFGRFAVPGNAYYAASKHAVDAISESLRLELAPFGIQVILIEPTATRTRLNANTSWPAGDTAGPYSNFRRSLEDWRARTYAGPPHNIAGRFAVSADQVAAVITRAATSRHPHAHYPVGTLARGLFLLRRWLPGPAFDAFVRTQFPAP